MQCAAVKTYFLLMIVPAQRNSLIWWSLLWFERIYPSWAIQGYSKSFVSLPPNILGSGIIRPQSSGSSSRNFGCKYTFCGFFGSTVVLCEWLPVFSDSRCGELEISQQIFAISPGIKRISIQVNLSLSSVVKNFLWDHFWSYLNCF